MDLGTLNSTSVFDVFSYNGEPVVALRLETLAPVVDRFVIVESRETFSGLLKDHLWKDVHADVFAPYADKIEWIVLDSLGKGDPWAREATQRNAPTEWLRQQATPYLALICDVDEIVSPDVVAQAKAHVGIFHTPVCLIMDFFYYNFEWRKPSKWYHAYVVNDEGIAGGTLDVMRLGPKTAPFPMPAGIVATSKRRLTSSVRSSPSRTKSTTCRPSRPSNTSPSALVPVWTCSTVARARTWWHIT